MNELKGTGVLKVNHPNKEKKKNLKSQFGLTRYTVVQNGKKKKRREEWKSKFEFKRLNPP